MRKKKKHSHLKKTSKFFLLLIIIIGLFFFFSNREKDLEIDIPLINREESHYEKQKQQEDYNNCLNKKYEENEITEEIISLQKGIDEFILNNNYKASVLYEDLTTGFTYSYNENEIYYGCSLIKIVDALYLINEAINNGLDLDNTTLTYTSNYKVAFSSGTSSKKIGEEISLRDLITYAVSVSDNTAHFMLIDYIGFNNLKKYGQDLGAEVILTGGDKFGNQTVKDTNIYLKEAYRLIKENKEYGSFLKNIMDNNERNAFNTENIKIYHKYGSYDNNYHDIGLSLDERPYSISVFTLHEKSNYIEVVQGIHEKVRKLHNTFYENRKKSCYNEIYAN